ncbi:MAG: DUF4832 domain-containing protein [Acidimicrobiia bacterium]
MHNQNAPTGRLGHRGWTTYDAARAIAAAVLVTALAACGSLAGTPGDGPASELPIMEAEWTSVDVGAVRAPGSAGSEGDGSILIVSAGEDVWSTADAFHFVYTELTGDAELIVRVDAVDATAVWAKAGLMMREGLESGDRNVFLPLTAARGAVLQARFEKDGATIDTLPGGITMHDALATAPWWLRLKREAALIVGYVSADGEAWHELGRVVVDLPETFLGGLAVTSHTADEPSSGRFSDLRVTGRPSSPVTAPVPEPEPGPGPSPTPPSDRVAASYRVDPGIVPNPDRGWYVEPSNANYAAAAAGGDTLAMRYVRLDEYRDRALPAAFLDSLNADLSSARSAGVKIVLRFAYNRSLGPDAPVDIVLQHIAQLEPILRNQADVISVVQAGFIGAWGEWHTSTNDLTSLANRRPITDALLDATPTSRSVQIRYPYYAREMFPSAGAPERAFSGDDASRVGMLNDCFLANGSDGGTYLNETDRQFTISVARTAPMGGETCDIGGIHERNGCASALAELSTYNWDYMNREFYRTVLERWQAEGCYDEIARRLGYRFVLVGATASSAVTAGGVLDLSLTIENVGFGKLFNPRPLEVVLVPHDGGPAVTVRVADDARPLLPLSSETRTLDLAVQLPREAAAGTYDVHLFLPDASASLRQQPAYSVRFANLGTWKADSGLNDLQLAIVLSGR